MGVFPLNQPSLASCTYSGWLLVTWFLWFFASTKKHNRNRLCLKLTWPCFSSFFDFLPLFAEYFRRILSELLPTEDFEETRPLILKKKTLRLLEPYTRGKSRWKRGTVIMYWFIFCPVWTYLLGTVVRHILWPWCNFEPHIPFKNSIFQLYPSRRRHRRHKIPRVEKLCDMA